MNYQYLNKGNGKIMLKIALTIRKKDDHITYFMNDTYYQFLSPYFQIELVIPRQFHDYHDIVERNDALMICGGNDIDPYYFHQDIHLKTHLEDSLIETMDFALIQQFYHARKPIIGICRGIQVLNVFFKGTLIQDIPSQYTTTIDHSQDNHTVHIQNNTFLSQYFPLSIQVNSFHHQNILKPSPLFHINAISEDGLIEGIENHQILAFQWHPERMNSQFQTIFITLIQDFIHSKHNDMNI